MTNKKILIIVILILTTISILIIFLLSNNLIGRVIKNYNNEKIYIYTAAICNKSNFCQDHIISCKNKKLLNIMPVSGAVVQHLKDWKDPRNSSDLC